MRGEILLAIRIGPSSAAPTRVAEDLARRLGAHVTVLYVATELRALEVAGAEAGVDLAQEQQRVLRAAETELAAFIAGRFRDVPASSRVVGGGVEDQIARVAQEIGADFIVVGTRGRGGLARLVLGDTTHAILQHTPCPVIVVPLRDEPNSR